MAAKLLSYRTNLHLHPRYYQLSRYNNIKQQFSLSTIVSYQDDYVVYTNGSASGGTRYGGAAAVVTRGSPLQPDVVTIIKTKGRTFTSSYEEEAAAMESGLSWTLTNANHHSITILFCTDSKSLCEALISHRQTFSICNSISSISSAIFIQWIPGPSSIAGNDLADKAAKKATIIATDTALLIPLSSSIQIINKTIRDAPPTQEQVAAVYKHRRVSQDVKQITNRKDDIVIARPRSGHHPSFKHPRPHLPELLPRRTRSGSLAPQLSSFVIRETTSLWVPPRVIRVACHPTWGCSGICKEDPG